MKLDKVVEFFNDKLQVADFAADVSNNGLQVETSAAEITKIAYSVDASMAVFEQAAASGAELLFVHHGLSWGGEPRRFTGVTGRRLQMLFEHKLSLYAVHLPLDAHAVYGHNAQMAAWLNLQNKEQCCSYHGMNIGWCGDLPARLPLEAVAGKLVEHLPTIPTGVKWYGKDFQRPADRCVIVSGGGGFEAIEAAWACKADTLIIGEVTHEMYAMIMESDIRVLRLGHYASETPGVLAVKDLVQAELGIPGVFVDVPTGL